MESVRISHVALTEFVAVMFRKLGAPESSARLVAESLVASNLRGVDSHGIQLAMAYAQQIENGHLNVNTSGQIVSENGACLVYDGQHGFGQVIADVCTDHAVRLARGAGLGMVVARHVNHYGASAWWAQRIARAGMIGFASCNATPLVPAWQGRDRVIGTNPICMAVPGPETFLLDMATTTVALNKIHRIRFTGETTIPAGWAMDAEGRPTTDAQEAANGLPMPLGGYKGSGLALMVEVLTSVLSGGAMLTQLGALWDAEGPMDSSFYFLAVDVARFMPLNEFAERMQFVRSTVMSSTPAVGYDEVLIAGEPEWRAEKQRRADGIPIPIGIWNHLVELAENLRIPAPALT